MSKSDALENDMLDLLFNGTAIADVAENDASGPLGSLYLALHTADPGEAGTQATNEVAYTNYARAAVLRTSAGFTVSGSTVTLTANVDFPAGGVGSSPVATHWSVGLAASGATNILYSGTITPNITCGNGVTPRLGTGTTITED